MSDNQLLTFPTFTLFLFLKKKKIEKKGKKEKIRKEEKFRFFFSVKDRYVDVNLMFPLETIYFRKHTQSYT